LAFSTPPRVIVLTSAVVSLGLALATVGRGWPMWVTALVALVAWIPTFVVGARWNYRRHHWLALFYVLVVTQIGHFFEHVAQMIQIHAMNLSGVFARGIFGVLDIEWVHFLWNLWVLLAALVLLWRFRENPWLWFTALFSLWHALEHTAILWIYLSTGVIGSPGWLSLGGAGGGLPVQRPDLHFLYNLIETVPLVIAFIWQLRQPRVRRAVAPAPRRVLPSAAFAPLCVVGLLGASVGASFTSPVKHLIAPDGEVACDTFRGLVQDVRAEAIPVSQIRSTLNDLQARSGRVDPNLRPALTTFIHAAGEAAASYYTYPTFDALAYSDTYAHMMTHEMTYETIKALSKQCTLAGYAEKPRVVAAASGAGPGTVVLPTMARDAPPARGSVVEPSQAVAAVEEYLSDKPWGFFGATCGAWASMHYLESQADIGFSAAKHEWVVDIPRRAEALGPSVLRYHVDAASGTTHGDDLHNLHSDFAEGCDKY
jgi:hypothetical protein